VLNSPTPSASRSGGRAVLRWLLPAAAILVYTLLVYAPALGGAFLRGDDLIHLAIARQYGPFTGFGGRNFDALPISASYYRPLFTLYMAALYRLFGVQYAGYQAAAMLAHAVAAVALFAVLRRLSGESLAAMLGALFFVSHPYASSLVTWVSDTGVYTVLIAGLVSLLLLDPRDKPGWYVGLAALLVLAPLTRENGVAICAAAFGYAIAAALFKRISTRQAARIAALAMGSVLVYALLRVLAMGALVRSVRPETAGLGFTLVSAADVQAFSPARRLALYAYTIAANLGATFFPAFTSAGMLSRAAISRIGIIAVLCVAFGAVILTWRRWPSALHRIVLIAAFVLAVLLGLLFVTRGLPFLADVHDTLLARFPAVGRVLTSAYPIILVEVPKLLHDAPPVAVTLGIAYAAAHSGEWPREHKVMALYALALIGAISAIAFAYFRWRNLNLALMGWLILFALAAAYLRERTGGRVIRFAMLALIALAVFLNGRDLFHELPPPDVLPDAVTESQLCTNKSIPEPIIMEVTATYGFDPAAIHACRAQP
jgi:hypothetical protein